jgi:hypothetical protein
MVNKRVNLVPLAHFTPEQRKLKDQQIRELYKIEGPLAFTNVRLNDDRSEFASALRIQVTRESGNFLVQIRGAVAIANSIAFLSEQLDPISIFLQLTRRNSVAQALKFLLWGEGETGIMVYEILVHYWHAGHDDAVRPLIFLMSS